MNAKKKTKWALFASVGIDCTSKIPKIIPTLHIWYIHPNFIYLKAFIHTTITNEEAYQYAQSLIAIAHKLKSDGVVVEHQDMSLTYGDFATLQEGVWLNDKVNILLKLKDSLWVIFWANAFNFYCGRSSVHFWVWLKNGVYSRATKMLWLYRRSIWCFGSSCSKLGIFHLVTWDI